MIDIGFAMMGAKLPQTQLVYNDYMCWEKFFTYRTGVPKLLERTISRNVPIDALGIQSHLATSMDRGHDEAAWHTFLEEI